MKKIILLVIVLVLIGSVYGAQGLITKTNFLKEPIQAYILNDDDGISFQFNEKEYVISIDEIGKNTARIKSFIYKENGERETFYIPLDKKLSYKFDFDKDGFNELKVSLSEVNNKTAVILFEKINEKKELVKEEPKKDSSNLLDIKGIIITSGIIIFGLMIYFIFRKK